MNSLKHAWHTWQTDRLLRSIVRNTGYLFSSSTISLVLSLVQSILAAQLLGVLAFGVVGIVITFASTLNRLFSFRMGEVIVKYLGQYQAQGEMQRGGALVKLALSVEGASSLLAFCLLLLLTPWAAVTFAKDSLTAPLFMFYGVSILGSLVDETANGILQIDRQFRNQALLNLVQSLLTAGIIAGAFFARAGIEVVLLAYLLGKFLLGIGTIWLAWRSLTRLLPSRWWRASLSLLPPWRELIPFGVSTNLAGTLNLIIRDTELLWVAFFLSPVESGYFRVALAIINLVMMPITPFITTTFPEISRAVAGKAWGQLHSLLKRVTVISGGWTLLAGLGILLFGNWFILFYGEEYLPAFPALLILLVGYGFANIFFWNRPLLLAFGMPVYPLVVMTIAGLIKVSLAFWALPTFGYLAEAVLLTGYFILSIGLVLGRGMLTLRCASREAPI